MAINIKNLNLLMLIPVLLFIVFYFKNGLNKLSKKRKTIILTLRTISIVIIILSIAGVSIRNYSDEISTIFLVDSSESAKDVSKDMKEFIEQSTNNKSKKDKVGIVSFGQDAQLEIPLKDEIKNIEFQANINGRFTNIENALKVSRGLLPDKSMKRLVLMTDGYENLGDSLSQAEFIKDNKIDFKVLKLKKGENEEVQIDNIEMPEKLYENQAFDITVKVSSNVKTKGIITLYSDKEIVDERQVNIEKSTNRFVFRDIAGSDGFKTYRAVITPENDTVSQNNEYSTYGQIEGNAKVLLIDGESNGARELEKILKSANIEVDYVKDKQAPRNIANISKYKSVIICDVSLENINNEFINALDKYVKDYGGGLLVTGGENSYALGGYSNSILEKMLPIDMEMEIEQDMPSLGIVFAIDKSGSMGEGKGGISKLEVAKDAIIKSSESIRPKDKMGVIGFDGNAHWVVKPSGNQNKEDIRSDVGSIRPGGGTSVIPALDEAYNELKNLDTKIKHIILLTDGHAEKEGYDEIIEKMKEEDITISTVAVGSDSDTKILESIANVGKGRYYFVDEYEAVPKIFAKETFLASKAYINNEKFTPVVASKNNIISPFSESLPELGGYIRSSNKERAEKILLTDDGDPLLSAWQYGLGRAIAWTSDVNGKWTLNYLESKEGISMLTNMMESTLPRINNSDIEVETRQNGSKEEIIVRNSGEFIEGIKTKVNIISPDLKTINIDLKASRPGEFIGDFETDKSGIYLIKINQYQGDKLINTANYATSVNYSNEYNINNNNDKLDILVERTKGKFITSPEQVFEGELEKAYGEKELSQVLLILSLLLFLGDIALRRIRT